MFTRKAQLLNGNQCWLQEANELLILTSASVCPHTPHCIENTAQWRVLEPREFALKIMHALKGRASIAHK